MNISKKVLTGLLYIGLLGSCVQIQSYENPVEIFAKKRNKALIASIGLGTLTVFCVKKFISILDESRPLEGNSNEKNSSENPDQEQYLPKKRSILSSVFLAIGAASLVKMVDSAIACHSHADFVRRHRGFQY